MLRFQTEDDAQTGEKVLTCYLLPQQPPPSLGRLLSAGGVARWAWSGWAWSRARPRPDELSCRGPRAAKQPFGELE